MSRRRPAAPAAADAAPSYTVHYAPPRYPEACRPWTCRHPPPFHMVAAVALDEAARRVCDRIVIRVTVRQVDDTGNQQLVAAYGYDGHPIDEAVRLQHFGASSNPPPGSEGHALVVGGRYDRAVLLGLEHPDHKPLNLPSGAKAIYDASGNIIKLVGTEVDMSFTVPLVATCKGGSLTASADFYLTVTGGNLYLGGKKGDSFSPVMTAAGPSKNVFAAI